MPRLPSLDAARDLSGADTRRRDRWRSWNAGRTTAAVLAFAMVLAVVLVAVGGSPVVLVVVAGVVIVLALAQSWGWTAAIGGTPILLTAAFLCALQVNPRTGIPLTRATVALLAIACVAGLVAIARGGAGIRLPRGREVVVAAAVLSVPAAWSLAMGLTQLTATPAKVSWRMFNDSTWNLMSSRIILLDQGVNPDLNPNPAPLTSGLLAAFMGPGRSTVSADDLLGHDLARTGHALVLAVTVLSVITGFALSRAARNRPMVAAAVGVVGALLPLTWFVSGLAFQYGFWNGILAIDLLVSLWLLWTVAPVRPALASGLMALASLALVGTWGPLVLIPAAMGLAVVVWAWRSHLRLRGLALAAWLGAVGVFLVYFAIVTLGDLRKYPTALAFDGAYFTPRLASCVLVVGFAIGALLVATTFTGDRWVLGGALVVVAASALGMAYLLDQRADAVNGAWGYYPAKFGWLVAVLILVIGLYALAGLAASPVLGERNRWPLVVAMVLFSAIAMAQIPPTDPRPISAAYPAPHPTPDWRLSTILPVLSVAEEEGASDFDEAAHALAESSDPRDKVLFSHYFKDPTLDAFANFWLLQQTAVKGPDDIRNFAYTLAPHDPASMCTVMTAWGGDVTVLTRTPGWPAQLRAACPGVPIRVARNR